MNPLRAPKCGGAAISPGSNLNKESARLLALFGDKTAALKRAHEAAIHDLLDINLCDLGIYSSDDPLDRFVGGRIWRDIEGRHQS